MGSSYKIKEIRIEKAPGFSANSFPLVGDLQPALNVIWGPNGIGKTTLAKAMRQLLWKQKDFSGFTVEGKVESDTEIYLCKLYDNQLSQLNMNTNKESQLKGRVDDLNDIYWLSLTSFLIANNAKDFHKIIYKELSGGIDLAQAAKDADCLKEFSNRAVGEVRAVDRALSELNRAKGNQKKVEDLTQEIASLTKEIESEPSLKEELEIIQNAISFLNLKEEIKEKEESLNNYDKRIAKIEKYHYNSFLEYEKSVKERETEKERFSLQLNNLIKELDDTRITKDQIENLSLATLLKNFIESLKESNRKQEASLKEAISSKAALEEFEKQYQFLLKDHSLLFVIEKSLDTLKELSSSIEPIRANLSAQEKLVELLGPLDEINFDKEKLERLRYLINEALSTKETLGKGILITAIIGTLAAVLALFVSPLFSLVSLASLIAVIILLKKDKGKTINNSFKKRIKELTEELKITKDENWDKESLISLLREVENLINSVEFNKIKINEQQKLAKEQEKLKNWVEKNREASAALNIDSSSARLDASNFFHFATVLVDYRKLLEDVASKESLYNQTVIEHQKLIADLQNTVNSTQEDSIQLISEAESLLNRLDKAKRFTSEIKKVETDLEHNKNNLTTKQDQLNSFLDNLEIDIKEIHLLEQLVEQKEQWEELKQDSLKLKREINNLKQEYPKSVELADSHSINELQDKEENQKRIIEQIKKSRELLGEKRNQYETFIDGSVLSKAESDYKKALEELNQLRISQVESKTVQFLFEYLEEVSQQSADSVLLQSAASWFERITSNRYLLKVNNEDFFAFDNVNQTNYDFSQLSDGTRIQLIFAIKIAFIESQEAFSGVKFPLFMDELLANSDDKRSLAIIKAISEIAKERQVFYFTAQADEVEKFKSYADEVFNEISMQKLWSKDRSSPLVPFVEYSKKMEVLDDYNSYLEILDVPKPTLFSPIEQTHAFYVFNKSEQLVKSINDNTVSVGQLRKPNENIALLRKAQLLAQKGRAKKFSLTALEETDFDLNKKANYYNEMTVILDESDNDANALVKALKEGTVKRVPFKEELIKFLENNGYATEEKPLSVNEILTELALEQDSDSYLITKRYLVDLLS